MTRRRRILVLQSGARPGPWTCLSLVHAGHEVHAAHDGRSGGAWGACRSVRRPLRSPSPEDDPDAYSAWLERTAAALGIDVVLPVTEGLTHLLARRYDGRVGDATVTGPGLSTYRALCDKDGLQETAARAGVAAPAGITVAADRGAGALPAPPCVVKPISSATPRDGGVVYQAAAVARDVAERDRLVALTVQATGGAMVQPLVEGPRWRLHFARSDAAFAAIAWRTVTSSPRDTGMSSVSRMAPVPAALGRAGSLLTAAAGYRGIGSLQFFETPAGFVVHDANLRPVFSVGASMRAGLDLPALAVAIALDAAHAGAVSVRPTRYVWWVGEVRGIAEDLRGGRPDDALRGVRELLGAAVLPGRVLDPSDPRVLIDTVRGFALRRRRDRPAATI